MKRSELEQRVTANITETHDALALLYAALPPGQQRTVVKNEAVKALLERYGVAYVQ